MENVSNCVLAVVVTIMCLSLIEVYLVKKSKLSVGDKAIHVNDERSEIVTIVEIRGHLIFRQYCVKAKNGYYWLGGDYIVKYRGEL